MQTAEAAALSRDLGEFLVEFSVSLHKHAIYPPGHPLLVQAVENMMRRLDGLLNERPALSLGVARHQLVFEGIASDPDQPILRDLATRLHRRGVGAVKFMRGIDPDELTEVLEVAASEPPPADPTASVAQKIELFKQWKNARLYALLFDQLELLEGESDMPYEGESGTWAAQLWLALARHAMADDTVQADMQSQDDSISIESLLAGDGDFIDGAEAADAIMRHVVTPREAARGGKDVPQGVFDPAVVARAIERRAKDPAYDQAIVSYLSRFAEEIRVRGGAEAVALQRRVSQLVGAMQPSTLRRLLDLGDDVDERRRFVLDASHVLEVETVVELVQAAADASNQSISQPMLMLLSKLAKHAEVGAATQRSRADWAVRENVRQLITGWDAGAGGTDNGYETMLSQLAREAPSIETMANTYACEPERTLEISLTVVAVGTATRRAVNALVARGKMALLLDLLESAGDVNDATEALWNQLSAPGFVKRVLRIQPVDYTALGRLVQRVGSIGIDPLLDALQEAEDRTTRWKLFDVLVQLGSPIGPAVVERLEKAPWYMQRNLLLLLGRIPEWPEGWTPAEYLAHQDARVRREALKLLLRAPALRDEAVCTGLGDADDSVLRVALAAALEHCPPAAVPTLVKMLETRRADQALRSVMIRAIARVRDPAALEVLLQASLARKRWFFSRRRLMGKSPELMAALVGLGTTWRDDVRAAQVIALATAHSDLDIRNAVSGSAFASERAGALARVDAEEGQL